MDGYKSLANAIILSAVDEYRAKLKYNKRGADREYVVENSEEYKFFYSEWFSVLTNINGPALERKLRREIWGESSDDNQGVSGTSEGT